MNCEDFRDSYELYSLGLLEGEERAGIEEHLLQGCRTCQQHIREALAMKALLLSQAPEVVPPSRLRRRVLASVGVQSFGWTWFATAGAAAMLLLALWFGIETRGREQELLAARQTLQQTIAERDRLMEVFSFLEAPGTKQVAFGQPDAAPPKGHVYLNPQLGVLLIATNLQPLPAGRAYEMWVIPPTGAPQPAGLFEANDMGTAYHVLGEAIDPANVGAVAVSIEPASGSTAPTTTPIIVVQTGA